MELMDPLGLLRGGSSKTSGYKSNSSSSPGSVSSVSAVLEKSLLEGTWWDVVSQGGEALSISCIWYDFLMSEFLILINLVKFENACNFLKQHILEVRLFSLISSGADSARISKVCFGHPIFCTCLCFITVLENHWKCLIWFFFNAKNSQNVSFEL